MVVLVDTNVIFDVIGKRQPHYSASNQILCLCRRKALVGIIAFHSVANIFYFYGKAVMPFLKARLLIDLEVEAASSSTIQEVLRLGISDLEDALQAAVATTARASFIVSRNVKDFKYSIVPAITPADFLRRFYPT
jgi:predicted nucleic acid-binding protein